MAAHFGDQYSCLPQPQQPHHAGQKRRAEEDYDTSGSGISTQLKRLRINHAPLHPLQPSRPRSHDHYPPLLPSHHDIANVPPAPAPTPNLENGQATSPPPCIDTSDFMPIDSTHSSRVFIHDLDAEIAAIEADELTPKSFFLADLDRKISNIPNHLLRSGASDAGHDNMQLVLYRDPTSISVPAEEDAVRKAIVDARKRMRERQAVELEETKEHGVAKPDKWASNLHLNRPPLVDDADHGPEHYYMEQDYADADMMDLG